MADSPSSAPPRLDDLLSYRLAVAGRLLRGWVDAGLAAEDVGAQGLGLLLRLVERDGLTQIELARRQRVEAPTVCRMVDRLVRDGLVERLPHPDDRRASRVVLTDEGRRVAERGMAVVADLEARAFADLDAGQRDALMAAAQRVIDWAQTGPSSA
ncbi:MAG: MarR family transcriptional regulator, lower aerobic nicotinate degradation pathway regulator [Miltoncostaeaceae bacterium]|nr:MarR family transcriptional regulator, lower aerobic nicotinate degradation pathway regulator [Miltoncostaeaceae bacterium]